MFPWNKNSTAVLSSDHNTVSSQDGTVFEGGGEVSKSSNKKQVVKIIILYLILPWNML